MTIIEEQKQQQQIYEKFIFILLSFCLALSRNSHNCYIQNVTCIFIKKNVIQQQSSVYSNTSNGKDFTVLFKMGLSGAINKLSLISKLKLLESLEWNH